MKPILKYRSAMHERASGPNRNLELASSLLFGEHNLAADLELSADRWSLGSRLSAAN